MFQILVQHIKTVLPGLKSRISSQLTTTAKELSFYGDPVESKVGFELKKKFCASVRSIKFV